MALTPGRYSSKLVAKPRSRVASSSAANRAGSVMVRGVKAVERDLLGTCPDANARYALPIAPAPGGRNRPTLDVARTSAVPSSLCTTSSWSPTGRAMRPVSPVRATSSRRNGLAAAT